MPIDYKAIRALTGTGARIRTKDFFCALCNGRGHVVADLKHGTLLGHNLPDVCHWPAQCPERVARGIFDRAFGDAIIRPTYPKV